MTVFDEFANLWERATPTEKKEIMKMIERVMDPPANKMMRKQADEVLTFLNEKTRRNYRHVETNLRPIVLLLKSGFHQEHIFAVVAMMSRKWAGDEKMVDFLRPKTLFNKTNFEQYAGMLGQ